MDRDLSEINISIIIPFINEKENIPKLNEELNRFISDNKSIKFEIVFVDDGSNDDSVKLLSDCCFNTWVKIIKLSKNFGSHAALRAGILNSKGKYVTFVYADLQDPLELIKIMYDDCLKGTEVVWAVRKSTNSGILEKLFSRLYAMLVQKFVNPIFPKNGFDVVMFNTKVRNALNQNIENNSSIFLHILNLGFKQDFISYEKQDRKFGKSKWTISKRFKLFVDSFVAFSYAPIRFVTITGIVFFFMGIFWTIYIIFREIFVKDFAPGWPALISILMIGFGISNISLGIIAEYLWRTLDASRKRPVFLIDEIIDLKRNNSDNGSTNSKQQINIISSDI